MASSSPRLWSANPNNSPSPLPSKTILFTPHELIELTPPPMPKKKSITLDELRDWVSLHSLPNGNYIDSQIDFSNSLPMLLAGELANPYRLAEIKAPNMPIIPVRLENLCRTWADSLDPREIQPGVHHVTLASSPGWWEMTHLTMLEIPQLKKLVTWLENGRRGAWRAVKSAEGAVRLENNLKLKPPSVEDISWDGVTETVLPEIPPPNGPGLDLKTLFIPVNTQRGCYDSRGRIIRCAHINQRIFHEKYFRRGSSKNWDDILKTS